MSIGSQIMGKGKGAAKALAGYAPVFQHLASEHGEVSAMMMRIANSDDIKTREETFTELYRNLRAHAHAEDKEFYPPLRQYAEIEGVVTQCMRDHEDIESRLEQLHTTDKSADSWMNLFNDLKQAVESHVQREENDLFPKANDLLDSDQASQIQKRLERVEEEEKKVI